jgi:hypothetical protein
MDQPQPQSPTPYLPQAALEALRRGRQIEAIKIVRQEQSLGLKEAKERVDLYRATHPVLRDPSADSGFRPHCGCVFALVGLVALIALGLFAYFRAKT